jgi:hypothetical protein
MKGWPNELNRTFSKEKLQMAKIYMMKCSPSLATKKIQIKTTLRVQLISVRMATSKIKNNNKCWQGCGEKEALIYCWWECKLV